MTYGCFFFFFLSVVNNVNNKKNKTIIIIKNMKVAFDFRNIEQCAYCLCVIEAVSSITQFLTVFLCFLHIDVSILYFYPLSVPNLFRLM